MNFEDILYEVRNGVAWITINRPDKMNAFRGTHLRRADQGAEQGRLRPQRRLHRARRRRREGLLHRRRPVGARRQLRRPRHHRPADGRAAHRHPRRAQAGDRPRAGLRHRRRQRAVHDLRPDDLFREGDLRPGRPEDGLGRSRLRHRLPGARGRREEGARDLVPEQALLGRRGGGDGPGQRLRAARATRRRRCRSGPRRSASAARLRSPSPSAASTWTPRTRAASPAWACTR